MWLARLTYEDYRCTGEFRQVMRRVDLLSPVLGFFITLVNLPEVSFEKCFVRSRLLNALGHGD